MKHLVIQIMCILAFISCENQDSYELKHETGQHYYKESTWNWTSISEDDYSQVAAPIFNTSIWKEAPQPVLDRIQWWINRLDKRLRSQNQFIQKHIPKPEVTLINNKNENAFVGSVPLCVDLEIKFPHANSTTTARQNFSSIAYHMGEDRIIPFQNDCIPTTLNRFSQFVKTFNEKSPSCNIQLQGDTLTIGDSCELDSTLQIFKGAKRFSFFSVLNRIHIYTGLIEAFDEKEFITILSHELAHYYKAHGTAFKGEYSYFYQEKNYSHLEKPNPDKSLELYYDQLLDASESFHTRKGFVKKSDTFSLNPLLFYSIGSLGLKSCSWQDNHCLDTCQELVDYLSGWDLYENLRSFPAYDDSAPVIKQIENLSQSCLQEITVSDDFNRSEKHMSKKELLDTLLTPFWTPNTSSIELQSIGEFLQKNLGKDLVLNPSIEQLNVWQAILEANQLLEDKIEQQNTLLMMPVKNHWGFFTTEQEADDLSLEYLSLLGLSPEHGLEAYHKLSSIVERQQLHGSQFPGIVDMQTCEAMIESSNSLTNNTSFGDIEDSHHSPCYRYCNIDLELKTHQYNYTSENPMDELSLSWDQIQKLIKE